MNITVYLGSSFGNDPAYREQAEKLGRWIAENGHTLVYGAGSVGLMGVLADSVLAAGGKVIGVIPQFMVDQGRGHNGLSQLYVVETMQERKAIMLDLGDCYIAFPGGLGTLEEISEAMTREKLGISPRKSVYYNCFGYYDDLFRMFDKMCEEGFLPEEYMSCVRQARTLEELGAIINE